MRVTRRLLAMGRGWPVRDPRDPNQPAQRALSRIQSEAQEILQECQQASTQGDMTAQLLALANAHARAVCIAQEAKQGFQSTSGGIARLVDGNASMTCTK